MLKYYFFARWQALLGKMSSSSSSKHDEKKSISQKLVPFPSQNRFSHLTPTSKNSQLYSNILQSKLVTPNITSTNIVIPFAKPTPPETQKSVTPSPSTKTYYVLNPNFLRVQILEDFQIHKLHQGFHILTNHLFEYYQSILQESGSVNFVHRSNSKEGNIDFSEAHITKIISPKN
uniref:Uncharacterized protein n=1 Tax=Lactuca sativa TaxID=4236 RepID=A0A9R1VEW0_LACSA|nr:hypothetical protein LSAT_V11C500282450 [Lactuca sativa]